MPMQTIFLTRKWCMLLNLWRRTYLLHQHRSVWRWKQCCWRRLFFFLSNRRLLSLLQHQQHISIYLHLSGYWPWSHSHIHWERWWVKQGDLRVLPLSSTLLSDQSRLLHKFISSLLLLLKFHFNVGHLRSESEQDFWFGLDLFLNSYSCFVLFALLRLIR